MGGLDGTGGGFDVSGLAAGERGDAGAFDLFGDGADGFEIAVGGDGETGFEDVDAEGCELMGHAELLVMVHGAAGRLLAVAEGGVEEDDLVVYGGVGHVGSLWNGLLQTLVSITDGYAGCSEYYYFLLLYCFGRWLVSPPGLR